MKGEKAAKKTTKSVAKQTQKATPENETEKALKDEMAESLFRFLCTMFYKGRGHDGAVDNPSVREKKQEIYTFTRFNEDDWNETLFIRRNDKKPFTSKFVKDFRPTLMSVVNRLIDANNALVLLSNYHRSVLYENFHEDIALSLTSSGQLQMIREYHESGGWKLHDLDQMNHEMESEKRNGEYKDKGKQTLMEHVV